MKNLSTSIGSIERTSSIFQVALVAIGVTIMGVAGFLLSAGIAQSAVCHQYTSSNPPAGGFAMPFSVFTNTLLFQGDCSNGSVQVFGGGEGSSYVIFKHGYRWTGSTWDAFTFSGFRAGDNWISGEGQATVHMNASGSMYLASYICEKQGDAWKCGCKSEGQCSEGGTYYWSLQKFVGTPWTGGGDDDDIIGDDDDVIGDDDDGTPWGDGDPTNSIPAPERIVPVSGSPSLLTAISGARCGDRIVLPSNITFHTNATISKDCTGLPPLQIVGETIGGPTIVGRFQILGKNIYIAGLKFKGESSNRTAGILLLGNDNFILRNIFEGWGPPETPGSGGNAITAAGSNNEIAYNEFHDPVWAQYQIQQPPEDYGREYGPNAIGIRGQGRNMHVHHNYFHDFPPKPGCLSVTTCTGGGNHYTWGQNDAIEVGESFGGSAVDSNWIIEYNLIERHRQGHGTIDVKMSRTLVRFNTVRDTAGRIDLRQGANSALVGNTIIGASGGIEVAGDNQEILGNVFSDGPSFVQIKVISGDYTGVGRDGNPAARNVKVIGNRAPIYIGFNYGTINALNTCYEGNTPTNPTLSSHQTGSVSGCGTPNYTGPTTASALTASQVGPTAPTAPGLTPLGGGGDDDDVVGTWNLVFSDVGTGNWNVKWTVSKAEQDSTGTITNTPQGIKVTAGRSNPGSVMLSSRDTFGGDIKVEYDLTILDGGGIPPGATGRAIGLLIAKGIAPKPVDLSDWTTHDDIADYQDFARGIWMNYAYRNPDETYLRLRQVPGYIQTNPDSTPDFPFTTGTLYHIIATKEDTTFSVSVKNMSTNQTKTHTWTASAIGTAEGNVAFRAMGYREYLLKNIKVYEK